MEPSQENISTVVNGFGQFYNYMLQTKGFNLQEFVNFMEPRFKSAGYRDASNSKHGNILILTETGVGDFVLSSGAIREIRRIYPAARITLLARPASVILAEACPYVDEVIVDPQSYHPINLFEFYRINLMTTIRLLEQRFDICFAFALHAKTFLLMYMSGAKTRVTSIKHDNWDAFNKSNRLEEVMMRLATHLFPYGNNGIHLADRFFATIENVLHLPVANRKTEIWYTPVDIANARELLHGAQKPLYAFSMGGTSQRKHYPPEKYAQLIEMILAEEPTATFVIVGGGKDDLRSAEALKSFAPKIYEQNIIDLTNKINYRQSAAVMSFCDMYIGNDTGTMHIAAALNLPVLATNCFAADLPLLNTDIPQIFYPYGVPSVVVQPAHALLECKRVDGHNAYGCVAREPHCIAQIKPETLLKGFHLLKKRVTTGTIEPLYIH